VNYFTPAKEKILSDCAGKSRRPTAAGISAYVGAK
jgi:hypothetical protein